MDSEAGALGEAKRRKRKPRIGLLNWSGNGNLGDDAMAEILGEKIYARGYHVINMGEHTDESAADAFIWGGGTLINGSHGIWPELPKKKPIIGFGLGLCERPGRYYWKNMKTFIEGALNGPNIVALYVRDVATYDELKGIDVKSTLSYDPVLWHEPIPRPQTDDNIVACNFLYCEELSHAAFERERAKLNGAVFKGFAMDQEDIRPMVDFGIECQRMRTAHDVMKLLSTAGMALVTRLHAYIFAYICRVPSIKHFAYDPKVDRFIERMRDHTHAEAIEALDAHLDEALALL